MAFPEDIRQQEELLRLTKWDTGSKEAGSPWVGGGYPSAAAGDVMKKRPTAESVQIHKRAQYGLPQESDQASMLRFSQF